MNNSRTGKGKIFDKNNNIIYDGDFANNEIDGYGKFNYIQGYYYIGRWNKGQRNGPGKLYNNNGILIYDGEWVNDRWDGIGKEINPNGLSYYLGDFKNGVKNGTGQILNTKEQLIYVGSFIDNTPEKGSLYLDNGYYYYGYFKNGIPDGKGILYYNNKIIYIGDFVEGNYQGYGKKYFKDGSSYFGNFKNNKMEGYGYLYDKNDKLIYKNSFKNDFPEGKGTIINDGKYDKFHFTNLVKKSKGNINWVKGDYLTKVIWNNIIDSNGKVHLNDAIFRDKIDAKTIFAKIKPFLVNKDFKDENNNKSNEYTVIGQYP